MHDKNTLELFDKALQIKSLYGIPFWDSLMTSTFIVPEFDDQVFIEALSHTDNDFYTELNRLNFDSFSSKLDMVEENLAAASKVKVRGDAEMHICMIDFNIPFSKNGTYVVKRLLKTMNQQGYLLCSGKSYHFYGRNLMTKGDYMKFLIKLIFLSPIVDKNWVIHQVLREQSFLRITKKYGHYPYLIENIE
jgi:hypothetical protein